MNNNQLKVVRMASVVLFLPFALPDFLRAQQNEQAAEVKHRNECRLAAQVLRTGEPRTRIEWARGYIAACAEEGPAALVSMWAAATADSASARYLIFYSSRVRDQRLYDEMRRTAQNRSRPDVVRVAAMLTLARYANPSLAAGFRDVAAPSGEITRIPLVVAWRSGSNQLKGAVPVRPDIGPELLQVLDGIAEDRSNGRAVWYAAAVLAKLVRIDVENG